MNDEIKAALNVIWEQLNGAIFDLTEGHAPDALPAIEDCVARLEALGIDPDPCDDTYDEYGVNTKNSFNTAP